MSKAGLQIYIATFPYQALYAFWRFKILQHFKDKIYESFFPSTSQNRESREIDLQMASGVGSVTTTKSRVDFSVPVQ